MSPKGGPGEAPPSEDPEQPTEIFSFPVWSIIDLSGKADFRLELPALPSDVRTPLNEANEIRAVQVDLQLEDGEVRFDRLLDTSRSAGTFAGASF